MIELPKPFKTNDLFKGGENYDLNACVGNNGGPYDEMDYGDGFFKGGQIIVDGAKDRKGPVDILVYPALPGDLRVPARHRTVPKIPPEGADPLQSVGSELWKEPLDPRILDRDPGGDRTPSAGGI